MGYPLVKIVAHDLDNIFEIEIVLFGGRPGDLGQVVDQRFGQLRGSKAMSDGVLNVLVNGCDIGVQRKNSDKS